MLNVIVFYSWQSDSPKEANSNFIQDALEVAIARTRSAAEISIDVALDRDTQDLPGSPEIARAIFQKIDKASLFVADVTTLNQSSPRTTPNPNVLIELGYAAARLGWDRIITVMNEEFGGPTKLPFDLQHRRWPIRYRMGNNAPESRRREVASRLSESLELAIRSVVSSGILTTAIDPKDRRAAVRFLGVIHRVTGTIAQFLVAHGYEEAMNVILVDHLDEDGTSYPSKLVVSPIIDVLKKQTWNADSTTFQNGKPISWMTLFHAEFFQLAISCDRLMDKYSERNDAIIAMIDDIHRRADMLRFMLEACSTPQLSHLYSSGMPNVHVEHYQYFLLALIKSFRVMRSFGAMAN